MGSMTGTPLQMSSVGDSPASDGPPTTSLIQALRGLRGERRGGIGGAGGRGQGSAMERYFGPRSGGYGMFGQGQEAPGAGRMQEDMDRAMQAYRSDAMQGMNTDIGMMSGGGGAAGAPDPWAQSRAMSQPGLGPKPGMSVEGMAPPPGTPGGPAGNDSPFGLGGNPYDNPAAAQSSTPPPPQMQNQTPAVSGAPAMMPQQQGLPQGPQMLPQRQELPQGPQQLDLRQQIIAAMNQQRPQ
jgi:hypothetical protein